MDLVDEELISQEANDRRLHQAISYLTNEGGSDSLPQYQDRVDKINEFIVHQYPNEGYLYDPKLYQQLSSMVSEQLSDFRRAAKENIEPWDDSEDIGEVDREDALYRHADDIEDGYDPWVGSSTSVPRPKPRAPARYPVRARRGTVPQRQLSSGGSTDLKSALVLETIFRYGGPNNEVEEYHRDFPASLPFGETFYMQEWESLKINFDLRKSAEKKKSKNADTTVPIDVPYGLAVRNVDQKGGKKGLYDSGSRFKIPCDEATQRSVDRDRKLALQEPANEFNEGGDSDQVKKDYAPRIFLEKLSTSGQHDIEAVRRAFALAASHRSSQSSRTSRTLSGSSPSMRRPSISAASIPNVRRPMQTRRAAASKANTAEKAPLSGPGYVRRATHVAPSPPRIIRPPGRPKWAPTTPTPLTTRGRAKRKLAEADDSYDKGKVKRARNVVFKNDEELEDVKPIMPKPRRKKPGRKPKAALKPATKSAKKPATKSVGKHAQPKREYRHAGLRAAEGYEKVKRGTTRSGMKFKK